MFNRRIEELERRVTNLGRELDNLRHEHRDLIREVAIASGFSMHWVADLPGHWTLRRLPEEPR